MNEHIIGEHWPEASVRLAMLEEACLIIRQLWSGDEISHYGDFFTVENARIYTLPLTAPPLYVSAFGAQSAKVAARIGDGMISTLPDSELLGNYASEGGRGPRLAQVKVAWAERVTDGQELVKQRWPTSGLSGELSQELRTPKHFEQAVSVLHDSDIIENFPCDPDPEPHLDAIKAYFDAGYDEVYVTQVGPDQAGFINFYEREILPYFRGAAVAS